MPTAYLTATGISFDFDGAKGPPAPWLAANTAAGQIVTLHRVAPSGPYGSGHPLGQVRFPET